MRRRAPAPLLWLAVGTLLVVLARPRRAQAERASPAPATTQPRVREAGADPSAHPVRSGIELLASVGWGASTADVLRLELSPYGTSFGLDVGDRWSSGFRLGGYFGSSLGRSVSQRYDPVVGREYELTSDTSSLNAGLSLAYDVPLYGFVLRYTLGLGVTVMTWEFAPETPDVASYTESPREGFHLAPGAVLLWPNDWFEAGVGFRYLVQADGAIPSGLLGELLVGFVL
jgi:hypothetical protein